MFCIHCGEEIPNHAKFCPYCGGEIGPIKSSKSDKDNYHPASESSFQPSDFGGNEKQTEQQLDPGNATKVKTERPRNKIVVIAIIIIALVVLFKVFSPTGDEAIQDSDESSTYDSEEVMVDDYTEYTSVTAKELYEDYELNAANASEKYWNMPVEVEGVVTEIDSDGDYFILGYKKYVYFFIHTSTKDVIACAPKDIERKDGILELKTGEKVIVKGTIRDISASYRVPYIMEYDDIK